MRTGARVRMCVRATIGRRFYRQQTGEFPADLFHLRDMGIFRTETALFWTFAENMRDYTPNGLRVQNTGFFQKIITPGNRAFSRVRTVGRFNPAPVPERFPPQLFQRYRLQTEPPPFWLIYPRTVGRANFPPGANFSKVNYIYFMGCNNYLNQWSNKTIKQ